MIIVFTSDLVPGADPLAAAALLFGHEAVDNELVVVVHDSDPVAVSSPVTADSGA